MIEAVENHNPEVIVIDEIGRELEAQAARTIAERGVQLIGTAHGNTLENLLLNPTLSDLVGGIESVTLSDDEAPPARHPEDCSGAARPRRPLTCWWRSRTAIKLLSRRMSPLRWMPSCGGTPCRRRSVFRDDDNKIHLQRPSAPPPGTASQALNRTGKGDTAPFSRSGNGKTPAPE